MITMTANSTSPTSGAGEPRHAEGRSASGDAGERGGAEVLRIAVGDLLHRPGETRHIARAARIVDLVSGGTRVGDDDPVDLDVRLESVSDGVVVLGVVSGRWQAECSRCLEDIEGPFELAVRELYEPEPVESETYLLEDDEIDLEPMVRDTVILNLPAVPLCDEECHGLCAQCGVDLNHETCGCATEQVDPRWDVLDRLEFEDS